MHQILNYIEDEIISIEPCGYMDTIDISVSGDHLFVANKILTHNCAYGVEDPGIETTSESIGLPQTVDAQLAIWTTDEDAQCSQINLGMMKNRFGPAVGSTKLHIDYQTLTLSDTRPVGQENALSGLMDKIGATTELEPVSRRLEYDPGSSLVDAFLGGS